MKPICTPCQRFFRPLKNGKPFIEGYPTHNEAEPGTVEPDSWRPYKLWMGDEWVCHGCGATIIVGCGSQPIAEHYQKDFTEIVEKFQPKLQVNDC